MATNTLGLTFDVYSFAFGSAKRTGKPTFTAPVLMLGFPFIRRVAAAIVSIGSINTPSYFSTQPRTLLSLGLGFAGIGLVRHSTR
jgi:hypothetical protein